jgi:hypothetical protein
MRSNGFLKLLSSYYNRKIYYFFALKKSLEMLPINNLQFYINVQIFIIKVKFRHPKNQSKHKLKNGVRKCFSTDPTNVIIYSLTGKV